MLTYKKVRKAIDDRVEKEMDEYFKQYCYFEDDPNYEPDYECLDEQREGLYQGEYMEVKLIDLTDIPEKFQCKFKTLNITTLWDLFRDDKKVQKSLSKKETVELFVDILEFSKYCYI